MSDLLKTSAKPYRTDARRVLPLTRVRSGESRMIQESDGFPKFRTRNFEEGKAMDVKKRILAGVLSGVGGTLALTGFRKGLNQLDLVRRTAPQQVVDRLGELGLLEDRGRVARRASMISAHYGYGTGAGSAFRLLRREKGGLATEAAVGAAAPGIFVPGRRVDHVAAARRSSERTLELEVA